MVKIIADNIGETGPEGPGHVHEGLKVKFLMPHDGKLPRPVSTSTLSTSEFEEYLSSIRRWAADPDHGLGIFIPEPNEVPFDY